MICIHWCATFYPIDHTKQMVVLERVFSGETVTEVRCRISTFVEEKKREGYLVNDPEYLDIWEV